MDFPYSDAAEKMIDSYGYEGAERRMQIMAATVANGDHRPARQSFGEFLCAFYRVASKQGHWPTVAT